MGEGGVIGHRAGTGDPRIELAQIKLAGTAVDEQIELEIAAVTFLLELLAEGEGVRARLLAQLFRERVGEDLVAAPAAAVRRQFGEADQFGHQRSDDGAASGHASLDRRAEATN